MFSKRRTEAASAKAAPKPGTAGQTGGQTFGQVGQNAQRSVLSAAVKKDPKAAKESAKAARAAESGARDQAKKLKQAEKEAARAARKAEKKSAGAGNAAGKDTGKPARKFGLLRPAVDEVAGGRADKPNDALKVEKYVWAPGEKPSVFNLSEWSLRRKVALVLAIPILLAAVFGGLRVRTEMAQADNYAATASQVTVLGPAADYLAAAERAAVIARAGGINTPKLDAAQQEVVKAGLALVEARDAADLTPTQLRQVNDVLSLSEQMRTGMAYVSLTSMVSQVRQLERGVTQVITTIVDEQIKPEASLLVLAQALDGRLSLVAAGDPGRQRQVDPAEPGRAVLRVRRRARLDRPARHLARPDRRPRAGDPPGQRPAAGERPRRQHEDDVGRVRGVRRAHRRPAHRDRQRPSPPRPATPRCSPGSTPASSGSPCWPPSSWR